MQIERFDHFVLTVAHIEVTCAWYEQVLGMHRQQFATGRTALHFGQQKINLHLRETEAKPKAAHPGPGSADFCLIVAGTIAEVLAHLTACNIAIVQGPVPRTRASGPIESVYVYDPDHNLVELASYRKRE